MLQFKYAKGSEFAFMFEAGVWQTDSYRAFGVYGFGYPQAFLIQGTNSIGNKNLIGNFRPQPEVWYNYAAAIGKHGDLVALIWDPSDSSRIIKYRERIGERWDNQTWQFTAKTTDIGMTLYIDNFAEIALDEIK